MTPRPPSISVAICTRDRPEMLGDAADRWAREMASFGSGAELVVALHRCAPEGADAARRRLARFAAPLRLIEVAEEGLSAARNAAWRAATGSVVMFVDDDAYPHEGFLEALESIARDRPRAVGFGGMILPDYEAGRAPDWLSRPIEGAFSLQTRAAPAGPYRRREFPYGCNMAYRREWLERSGGFEPTLYHAEDKWIAWQAKRSGALLWRDSRLAVRHRIPAERAQMESLDRIGARSGYWEARRLSLQGGIGLMDRFAWLWLRPVAAHSYGVGRGCKATALARYASALRRGFAEGCAAAAS